MSLQQVQYHFFKSTFYYIIHLDHGKLVTSRNMIPATSKPEGFSKGAREMWWNLVRDCTQPNPSNRPVISVVVARLYLIQHHIEGMF